MILADEDATLAAGRQLGRVLRVGDVLLLSGGLGAGKTTFARGILRGLDFTGDVASPTFPILLEYAPPDTRLPVTHADLYRIDDPAELEQLDLAAGLVDGVVVIEWPDRLRDGMFPEALHLTFDTDGAGRRLTAQVGTAWGSRWPIR